ncbi:MAG: hypothetical protein KatS3mg015_2928 [Fimbriimonadales bacterium]|nr:MAG: hypothetical protein KatS3mg015_2928 [Fimbriimonadales bacterium]
MAFLDQLVRAQPFGRPRPITTNAPYQPYTARPEDPAGYAAAVNRARQRAANQAAQSALQQQYNAANYFANIYGFSPTPDPVTGAHTPYSSAQIRRLQGQQMMTLAERDYLTQQAQQDYAANLARLGLAEQELALQRAGLNRRLGSGGYFDQLAGLIDRSLANQLRGFDITDLGSFAQHRTQRRGEISDATARGALTVGGTRADLRDIDETLMRQLAEANLGREAARLGAERERVSLAEQRAQEQERARALDLKAQEFGMDREQFKRELERGLHKLNLDAFFSSEDILDRINSTRLEDRMLGEQILQNAMANASYFPATTATTRTTGTTTRRPSRGGIRYR